MTTTEMDRDRAAPLELSPEQFRQLGHRLVDRLAEFLAGLRDRRVTPGETPAAVRARLGAEAPLPEGGSDPSFLLDEACDLLLEHSLFNGHPRFWGYITASAAPLGSLAELLAATVNPNVGAWTLSPMASEIEAQTVRWIAELLGYPTTCGGLLVSGGNQANFVCFLAARTAQLGEAVRSEGLASAHRLRAYASAETHTWLQKAADLFGLGTGAVRWIPTDSSLRMDPQALRSAIARDREAGDRPFLVVGTAGSVSTGAVDPLPELATICREFGLWFHVDGAYGGFAAVAPEAPAALRALELADSLAIDPHKWLYAPLEAGCALVRDPAALRGAFAYHPPYYHFGVETTNFVDLGPQNSRGFRALKVWLALRQVGRSGYARMIGDDIRLAAELHREVAACPGLEPCTQDLSISTFRYVPPDLPLTGAAREDYLNELNRELLTELQNRGEFYLSNAVIAGKFVLRACICNFRTSQADVAAAPGVIAALGHEIDQARRQRAATVDAQAAGGR